MPRKFHEMISFDLTRCSDTSKAVAVVIFIQLFAKLTRSVNTIYDVHDVLFDQNETTCSLVTFELKIPITLNIPLTSFRYVGKNADDLWNLTFFREKDRACDDGLVRDNNVTLDGYCSEATQSSLVTVVAPLAGVTLCDIYISGGRLITPDIARSYVLNEDQITLDETCDLNLSTSFSRNVVDEIYLVYKMDQLHDIISVRYIFEKPSEDWTFMSLYGVAPSGVDKALNIQTFYNFSSNSTPLFPCSPNKPTKEMKVAFECQKKTIKLVLYELVVFGECALGRYGLGCTKKCSEGCNKALCHVLSGQCFECPEHYFGKFCEYACSQNCLSPNCTQLEGSCTSVCKLGFYGHDCNTACSSHCVEGLCDPKDGTCKKGCQKDWFGPRCDGCAKNCKDNACDNVTGTCTFDCPDGFFGPICSDACKPNCKSNICDRSGACSKGCNERFAGRYCEESSSGEGDVSILTFMIPLLVVVTACIIGVGTMFKRRKISGAPPPLE